MTDKDLRKAQAALEAAFARAEALRASRDEMVTAALAAGWTHARIAEATGLTRGRIGQFAQRQPKS